MKILVLFLALSANFGLCAQNYISDNHKFLDSTFLYLDVDDLPKFESNNFNTALEYIYSKIEYPNQLDVFGSVIVSFIVTKNGVVEDVKIEKSLHKECDNEVKRVLRNMPKWIAGKKDNQYVSTLLFIRVDFTVR